MDRCKCWKSTTISIKLSHCPSLDNEIKTEMDRVIDFVNTNTKLSHLGKVRLEMQHDEYVDE